MNENMRTVGIVAEALIYWNVIFISGLRGDGIIGFIEALRQRQSKFKFILVRHEESAAFMAFIYAKYITPYYTSRMLRNYGPSSRPFKISFVLVSPSLIELLIVSGEKSAFQ
jgi:hypothetical protein